MDILDACVSVIREHTMQEWKSEVTQTLEHLKATRKNFPLIISDHNWLFRFIVERPDLRWKSSEVLLCLPDLLTQKMVTEQEVWSHLNEVLAAYPLCVLPALPETSEKDPWWAVMTEDKLYCCGCRSLYEGVPLTESQMSSLRDTCVPFCAECECDL